MTGGGTGHQLRLFREAWLPALLNLRRRRWVVLGDDGCVEWHVDKKRPPRRLAAVDLHAWKILPGHWLARRFSVQRLRLKFRDETKASTWINLCVGEGDALIRVAGEIERHISSHIGALCHQAQASTEAFEREVASTFRSDRYLRGSVFERWINNAKPRWEALDLRGMAAALAHPWRPAGMNMLSTRMQAASELLREGEAARARHNDSFIAEQAAVHADYFRQIESSELSKEQIKSSLIFDDANVTVAAAGSGKTSVMVSKVGYALKSQLFEDREVILLAYNTAAAKELRARVQGAVSGQLGRDVKVTALTFHAFGRLILRDARRRHRLPKLPKVQTLDKPAGRAIVKDVLRQLQSQDVFANDLLEWLAAERYPAPRLEALSDEELEQCERRYQKACTDIARARRDPSADVWDPTVPTFDPKLFVRSFEEARIANWLYLRNVTFQYEVRHASKEVRAYLNAGGSKDWPYVPDFAYRLPGERDWWVYHEHFGLNADGQAPDFMGGARYEIRARKKRDAWEQVWGWLRNRRQHVPFFETRSAWFADGTLFDRLRSELERRGIVVGPLDQAKRQRALEGFLEDEPLVSLIVKFVGLYRESGLTMQDLMVSASGVPAIDRPRALGFLRWMAPVLAGIADRFDGKSLMDFSDMLTFAIQQLKAAPDRLPVKFILVDEFQDISRLRAQFVQALLDQHAEDSLLFCVGDDWQAINRFAGADIQIFSDLYFGASSRAKRRSPALAPRSTRASELSQTYRCPHGIAMAAGKLVLMNEGQIPKPVQAKDAATTGVIKVVEHPDTAEGRISALRATLDDLAALPTLTKDDGTPRPREVFILTRYRKDSSQPDGFTEGLAKSLAKQYAKPRIGFNPLDMAWTTLHSSKGLGRDHVVILGMDSGYKGFPSQNESDPLLDLVLPPQLDPLAEERRLFYVGLTRAKKSITLLAAEDRPSEFILDLAAACRGTDVLDWPETTSSRTLCRHCKRGWLKRRAEQSFAGCTRYPRCGYRESLPTDGASGRA